MNLYSIASHYKKSLDELTALDDISQEIIEDTLSHMKDELDSKVINIAAYLKILESDVFEMREYEKNMAERRRSVEKKIKNLESYVIQSMNEADVKKISGSELDVSIRINPPSVKIINDSKIDDLYLKVSYEIDKKSIKEAMKKGEKVEGAELRQSSSVIIK